MTLIIVFLVYISSQDTVDVPTDCGRLTSSMSWSHSLVTVVALEEAKCINDFVAETRPHFCDDIPDSGKHSFRFNARRNYALQPVVGQRYHACPS